MHLPSSWSRMKAWPARTGPAQASIDEVKQGVDTAVAFGATVVNTVAQYLFDIGYPSLMDRPRCRCSPSPSATASTGRGTGTRTRRHCECADHAQAAGVRYASNPTRSGTARTPRTDPDPGRGRLASVGRGRAPNLRPGRATTEGQPHRPWVSMSSLRRHSLSRWRMSSRSKCWRRGVVLHVLLQRLGEPWVQTMVPLVRSGVLRDVTSTHRRYSTAGQSQAGCLTASKMRRRRAAAPR